MDLGNNRGLQSSSLLQLSVKLTVQTQGGFMFDYQGAGDFKFVGIDAQAKRIIIGHYTDADGWAVDARVTRPSTLQPITRSGCRSPARWRMSP